MLLLGGLTYEEALGLGGFPVLVPGARLIIAIGSDSFQIIVSI
jgi:hypothetical protein